MSYKISVKLAENDHRVVTKCLYEVKCGKCWRCLPNEAASSGRLEIVQWLHSKKMRGFSVHEWSRKVTEAAVVEGHLNAVKWLFFHVYHPLYPGCLDDAARSGNVDLLEFLQMIPEYWRTG
ncbi:hypothetical protein BBJ29_009382 [Phytophthora kernoviae]|uniref:Uncharacterized protein n=1 Tax=Phytophthora kernoviae TaxID=325452 RepID=A0A3F2RDZ3_9STRA|nr:hypothetical protein BBP00_00009066 [Phytophthora kernoviae]RLN62870.1 hypothetical protein BBJ29_009382 [Phytophthora kernoviae]